MWHTRYGFNKKGFGAGHPGSGLFAQSASRAFPLPVGARSVAFEIRFRRFRYRVIHGGYAGFFRPRWRHLGAGPAALPNALETASRASQMCLTGPAAPLRCRKNTKPDGCMRKKNHPQPQAKMGKGEKREQMPKKTADSLLLLVQKGPPQSLASLVQHMRWRKSSLHPTLRQKEQR